MAETLTAGEALIALRADASQLSKDMQAATATVVTQLQKIEENTKSVGLAALAKQVEEFARATATAQKDVTALKFAAIADEVNSLTSAFKGAEDGVRVSEDLAAAEKLLEERFAMVRAEIERQATAQRGLVDEEVLLERTTLALEAAQRQHDQALATVRGRALQAAEGLAALEAEEQASALAAQKAWEATAQLAIEQDRATKEAAELAEAEARTAQGLANLGTAITHAAEETQKANARWAALKPSLTGVADAAQAAGLAFGAFAGGVGVVAGSAGKLTMEAARIGESFNDLAIKTSTTVEALSRYDLAAKTADVSQETLAVGMRKLAQAAVEAGDEGSESAKAFDALGVEVRDANGNIKPMGQLLQETTRALADAGEGAETMASAQQLLGRSALDFLPLAKMTKEELDDLAKASEELGLVWSTKDAAAADKLSDSVTVLGAGVKGLGLSIGRDLIPVAQQVVDESLSWLRANSELMRSGFKDWVVGVKQIIEGLAPLVRDTADAFLWWGGGLDNTFGGLNQQIVDTEAKMKDLKRTMDTPLMATGEVDRATKEYKHLAIQLEGLKVRAEQAKNAQAPLAAAVDETTTSLRDQKVVAKETGEQFDAMLINWEDANKAAEEAKKKQKEAAAEAKRLSDVNRGLADSIEQLKLDALADDLDDATEAMERSKTVVADENYLRALQDIEAAYNSQVEAAKRATEESIAAGADRTLAAEEEALKIAQLQREMADAVEKLNIPLQKNAEFWGDVGAQLAELPPELSVISPQFAALGVATGQASLATFGLAEATKEVTPAAQAASGTISDLSKAIVGLIDGTTDAGDVLQAFAGGLVDNLGGAISNALGSSQFGKDLTSSLSGVFGPALGGAIATAGMSAVVQVGAGIFMSGVKDAMEGEAMSAAAKIGLVVGGPIGAAIGVGIVSAFGIGQKSMVEQIAAQLGEMFKASFKADAVVQAINEGLVSVGSFLGPGLETIMIRAPKDMGAQVTEAWRALGEDSSHQFSDGFYQDMKEKGTQLIHSSIADVLHVLFPQISKDLEVGIQQSAVAAGSAIAAEMGLLGDKAIKFAQQWGIAFIGMAQKAGLSADEILTALHRIDTSLGTSQELVASLQRLQAVLIDSGEDVDLLFQKINEQLRTITGKKVKVGNLDEVLAAVGGDATRALGVIENGMEMAGISIEKFTGQLSDVVLAISGDAGTAIREAGEDFRRFGNEADGTAGILREKVLSALDAVIATAEELGYSTESIDAFKTAVGLIPPEMLRSSEFANALREDFARMAVESHMSVQELVDSIDPPLPEATRNAILAVNDLGKAIGDLAGAPLKNLKEVTDRMKQFGAEMYREVKDAEGNVTRELTAFGQELIDEASTAISGMWSQMNEDGWVGLDEIGVMFDQLALLPVEAMNDPAIQQATRDLLAKIGAMTGDAAIIAMANAETITQDMIDQGLAAYEEYKSTIEDNPVEVPPPPGTDGQPVTDPTQDPTAAATGAPPPQPIPPETTASYQTLADTATEYAKAVLAGREAVEALAATTVEASARMLESLRPLIGTPDDGVGLAAIEDMIARRLIEALEVAKEGTLGATGVIHDSFDYARGAVLMLTDAINAIPDKTVTITVNQVGGTDVTTSTPLPGGATGGWIPGAVGEPFPMVAHGGEFIIPADIAQRVVGGGTAPMMATRSADPASTSSASPDWVAVPVRRKDLAEGAVLELARATQTGRAHVEGRQIHVSPTYGRRR